MLRLGIGAGLAVALAFSAWWLITDYGASKYDEGYRKAAVEIKKALQVKEDEDVNSANAAEAELPPTPDDIIALIAICNGDPACRNRGQQ